MKPDGTLAIDELVAIENEAGSIAKYHQGCHELKAILMLLLPKRPLLTAFVPSTRRLWLAFELSWGLRTYIRIAHKTRTVLR